MARSPLVDRLRASAPQISVGVLTADWLTLGSQLEMLESAGVDLLHFDVMDGVFCPMLTLGAPVVAGLKTRLLKDVHLMIEDPLSKLDALRRRRRRHHHRARESTRHIHRVLQASGQDDQCQRSESRHRPWHRA